MIIFPLDVPFKVVNEHTSHYNSSQTLYKDIPFRRDVRAWSSLSCPFSSENDRYRQKPQRFLEGKHLSFRQYFTTFSGFRTIGLRVAFCGLAPHLALGRYRYCRTRQGGFTLCHGPTACKGWLLYWWRTGGRGKKDESNHGDNFSWDVGYLGRWLYIHLLELHPQAATSVCPRVADPNWAQHTVAGLSRELWANNQWGSDRFT